MRHSTIELTMTHYTDVRLLDTRSALEKLPAADLLASESLKTQSVGTRAATAR
jgi:hypothetical protein